MIERAELRREIERLERSELTYDTCYKLASLYTLYDHVKEEPSASSFSSSEFLHVARQAPTDRLLKVMDTHMQEIMLLYPKEYEHIIAELKK